MDNSWLNWPGFAALMDLIIIVLLIGLNGIFAFAEIAVVSAKKVRLQQLAKTENGAKVALELAEEPTAFLSTVQIGITLIGILAGALGGTTLAARMATWLEPLPVLGAYAETISFAVVVVFVTYLSLTVGELAPKALALNNPEQGAMIVARPLQLLSRIALPIVQILSYSTEKLLHLLGTDEGDAPPVTEEELKALAAEGAEAGVIEQREQHLVERALNLDDISLHSLVTHRTQVDWLDTQDSIETVRQIIAESTHSWFPLCNGSLDNVVGLVRARDALLLIERWTAGTETDQGSTSFEEQLRATVCAPLFVPLTTSPVKVLELFRDHPSHIAFAVDEYGGVEGMVTSFDVLEALVGTLS